MGITLYSNSINELTVTSQFSIFNLISILNSDYFGQSPVRLICYPYPYHTLLMFGATSFQAKKLHCFQPTIHLETHLVVYYWICKTPHDTCCQKCTVPTLSLFLFSHRHMLLSHVDICKSNHGHIPHPPSATAPKHMYNPRCSRYSQDDC